MCNSLVYTILFNILIKAYTKTPMYNQIFEKPAEKEKAEKLGPL
jgi:hypothetical protein